MIQSSWETKPLSDLADMCLGKMLDQQKNKGDYYPYLANTNVHWGKIDLDGLREMRFETKEFERYGLKTGDIVMCEGGEPGRCALWKGQTESMMIQKALHRIRAKPGVNSTFLFYMLFQNGLQGHYEGFFTGSAIKHLTGVSLAKIKFKIPPLEIQTKVAAILSAYDDLIENNLKRIKLLEEMAQITYEEWFVRMKFPGHENAVIDTETDLPDGWNKGIVTDLCKVNSESITSKSAPQLIKYIDISSANTGGYEAPERLHFVDAPSRARRKVNRGDTIFSTVRPNRQIYSLIMHSDPELVASTGFAVLTPHEVTHFSFVYLSVAEQGFVDRVVSVASGAAYPAVNQRDFEKISVIIPDQAVLDLFSNQVNHCFESIALLKQQNELLREARDILLPRLMTGMINIDQVEVPEVLLQRVSQTETKEAQYGHSNPN